jgi:hypothetical protein
VKAATYTELVRAGYTFLGRWRCPRCGEEVALFLTPNARKGPFVLLGSGRYLSHFATCPEPRKGKGVEGGKAQCEQMKLI